MKTIYIQLFELAKDLSIPNFHCICKDKINQYPTETFL